MVDKILVIDSIATSRIVLRMKLAAACYEPLLAPTAAEGVANARAALPNLIVVEAGAKDLVVADVLRQLRTDPRCRSIPVIAIGPDDADTRIAALRAGAEDYLPRPLDDTLLLARIRNLLRLRAAANEIAPLPVGMAEEAEGFDGPATICIVAERAEVAQRWQTSLMTEGRDRTIVMTREEALSEERRPPDVYLVDGDLGGVGAGTRFLSDLRSRAMTRNVPVCLVQARPSPDGAAMAFDLGANDVVPARISGAELSLRLRVLSRLKRRMERRRASVEDGLRMAMIDPLTGLYNRRFAMPQLAAMADRASADMAVLVVDLDKFKSVNDRFGHAAGDTVLVEVARRLACNLRPADLLARIGGEEFLIALPDLQLADARVVADRLCAVIQSRPVHLPSGEPLIVTISIGLATRGRRCFEPVTDTMERADKALLTAKASGRNQVTVGSYAAQGQAAFTGAMRIQ